MYENVNATLYVTYLPRGEWILKFGVFIHKDGFLAVKMDVLEQKAFNN